MTNPTTELRFPLLAREAMSAEQQELYKRAMEAGIPGGGELPLA